ncbi:hypothetical protein [Deinococcus sp. UYEF24]
MRVHLALLAISAISVAFASPECYPAVTLVRAGHPVPVRDQVISATLTPIFRAGEVYLPIRYVGSVLIQSVSVDAIWNTFTIEESTFRVGEKESHQPAPTLGGVDVISVQRYDVSPFLEANRMYIPLKMLPWLNAQRTSNNTVKLVPKSGHCP